LLSLLSLLSLRLEDLSQCLSGVAENTVCAHLLHNQEAQTTEARKQLRLIGRCREREREEAEAKLAEKAALIEQLREELEQERRARASRDAQLVDLQESNRRALEALAATEARLRSSSDSAELQDLRSRLEHAEQERVVAAEHMASLQESLLQALRDVDFWAWRGSSCPSPSPTEPLIGLDPHLTKAVCAKIVGYGTGHVNGEFIHNTYQHIHCIPASPPPKWSDEHGSPKSPGNRSARGCSNSPVAREIFPVDVNPDSDKREDCGVRGRSGGRTSVRNGEKGDRCEDVDSDAIQDAEFYTTLCVDASLGQP